MIETLMALFTQLLPGTDLALQVGAVDFFSSFGQDMNKLIKAKDYLAIMLDWRIIVFMVALGAFGLYLHSKVMILFVFAMYGISATYHFSIGPNAQKANEMTQNVDNIAVFVGGILVVGIVIIYYAFIRGD